MQNEQAVTAIVPAYDEAPTIASVIKTLQQCPSIRQIIVVDDGSHDKTPFIAKSHGVTVLSHKTNRGKSEAIVTAIPHIRHDIVFLCDADQINLTPEICEAIMQPVIHRTVSMSIGLHNYGAMINTITPYLPSVSGDRAIEKRLLIQCTKSKYFTGYGMELVFHYYCVSHNYPIFQRPYGYNQLPTLKKRGILRGIVPVVGQALFVIRIFATMHLKGWH